MMKPAKPLDSNGARQIYALADVAFEREEIELICRLSELVDLRLPANAQTAERRALVFKLVAEDPECSSLAARLDSLIASRGNRRPVAHALAELTTQEELES